ncbi:DUF4055 domain-containing protein [Carnimonas bestiolae]|uniref:DUF4055 domain-containing protein n=1 Tax=Carnimonas bestiolae TaxID=3402172 RepID=UPI003EDBAB96
MSNGHTYKRPEYSAAIRYWELVRDCVEGSRAVKSRGERYMVKPDPDENCSENRLRLEQLIKRAMYLNVTGRTRNGLLGAVFRKDAEIELPTEIAYLEGDASGDGVSLKQFSKRLVSEQLVVGRGGILAEFPTQEVPTGQSIPLTKSQTQGKRAHIHFYPAESIINWHAEVIGGVRTLTLVVLMECVSKLGDDGFSQENFTQYRVLRLSEGVYSQELYIKDELASSYYPTRADGSFFDHIPFHFAGAESNEPEIGGSPLYDLAEVNILHYQNSATVEDSAFIASQPSLFLTTSMTAEQFAKANPDGIKLGARKGHNLGNEGSATLLQANETQLALELMRDKEQQMVKIGARLVQDSSGQETAEAARIRYSSDNSVLSHLVGNATDAIRCALYDALAFMTVGEPKEDAITFKLNEEFFDETLDAQTLLAIVQSWQQGVIGMTDLRDSMRKAGYISPDRTDDEIDAEIAEQPPVTGSTPDDEDDDNEVD